MTNMEIWNKLEKTDPKHTKDFKRAGGFSGTAIKPMYAIQKMTEVFGPCGNGWGYTKPDYQIVDGADGQKLVYCVVGLWTEVYNKDSLIYGVGGDFIVIKRSSGLVNDDEAFKKAFTDALMNAMKHLGMSADVHMGQFDGNKYIEPQERTIAKADISAPTKPRGEAKPMSEADIDKQAYLIGFSKDADELLKFYNESIALARAAGDEEAYKKFTDFKNIRKKELESN